MNNDTYLLPYVLFHYLSFLPPTRYNIDIDTMLHYVASAIAMPMGTCFSCFTPLVEKKDTATVDSSINTDVADAPNLAKYDPADDVGNDSRKIMDVSVMLQSMSARVQKGALAATPKEGALINVVQWIDEKVVVAKATFDNVLNDKVTKTRTAEVEWKIDSSRSTNKEVASSNNGTSAVPVQSAVP